MNTSSSSQSCHPSQRRQCTSSPSPCSSSPSSSPTSLEPSFTYHPDGPPWPPLHRPKEQHWQLRLPSISAEPALGPHRVPIHQPSASSRRKHQSGISSCHQPQLKPRVRGPLRRLPGDAEGQVRRGLGWRDSRRRPMGRRGGGGPHGRRRLAR